MPPNKAAASELGTIDAHGAEFRAHIKFRNDAGEQKHIHGPSRATENEAQKDLEQIRAAGSVGSPREEGRKVIAAEAQCTYIHYVSSILCIFNRAYLHNNKTRPEHQETQLYNGLFIIVSPFVPACLLDYTDSRFLNNPRHDFNTLSNLSFFFLGLKQRLTLR